jgi:hypothetical protein
MIKHAVRNLFCHPAGKITGTSVEKLGTHLGEEGGDRKAGANNRGSEASLPIV